ncbi:hypothetical protein KQH82_04050 [bacterium]|nr:hypothetical protein [bacterium]
MPYRSVPTRSTDCPDGWNPHITMSSLEHSQLRTLVEVPGMFVKGSIAHLNPYSRLMLVLLYCEQFTYEDIGYITDLPGTSVRAILTRLRIRIPRYILEFARNVNRIDHPQPVGRTNVGEVDRGRRTVYIEFPFPASRVVSADAAAERWENEGGALVGRNGG